MAIPPRILKVTIRLVYLKRNSFLYYLTGNAKTCSGSSCRNLCWAKREKPQTLLRQDRWTHRDSVRRRHLWLWALLARWVPNGSAKGPFQNEDLPSQHRQARQNLPWYLEEQVVPCSSDQIGSPVHSGTDVPSKLGWSFGPGDCGCLEGRSRRSHQKGKGVDASVRQQLSRRLVRPQIKHHSRMLIPREPYN